MRILFVSAVEFGAHCLEQLLAEGADVVGVLTLPPEGAARHSDYADLGPVAARWGVDVYQVVSMKDAETAALVRSLCPDVIFVFGWSEIVPAELLKLPPLGCIGTHPALLPRHRGRHPIVWALVEGLRESGLTFFYLDEGVDSGDILWQRAFPIGPDDDARTVYDRVKALAADAIGEFLPQLASGTAPRILQDHSQASYWRRRTEADGEIGWAAATDRIYNLVRALARPYVGAHTFVGARRVRVWQARPARLAAGGPGGDAAPGTVLAVAPDGIEIRTGDGVLTVVEYHCEGPAPVAGTRLGGCS